jgi:glycosyltransferase involved in cell wall biosynthesis
MKSIAVNTRLLMPGKLEGIGWFTFQVLKRIVTNHPEYTFYFIFDRPYDPSVIFGPNVVPIVLSPPSRHPILWYIWFEIRIPQLLKKLNTSLFLSTDAYTSLNAKTKKVTVIHDIAFEFFDQQVTWLTQKYMRYFSPKYAQQSDIVVTVSESTKNDLVRQYQIDPQKIVVSSNAANEMLCPIDLSDQEQFKKEHTDGCEFFVYIGSIHPRKNVLSLLQAFEIWKKKSGSSFKFVLIGRKAWDYKDVDEYYDKMTYRSDVIFVPHASHAEMHFWLASANTLLYVSLYEGFGIPILEAMQCGVPVITSNVSSMPEVAGDAALLVDPKNANEIVSAMDRVVSDLSLRNELIQKGLFRAKKYSWDTAAEIIWNEIAKKI